MKDPLFLLVLQLLSKNKISYDKKELAFQIKSHPSYPSLHAITGVLDHFNIENIAAEVPTDETTLAQLPDTFIAQVSADSGPKLVTVSKNKSGYTIFSDTEKNKAVSTTAFLSMFTGIIVAVEKDEHEKPLQKKGLQSVLMLLTLIILVGSTFINKNIGIADFSYVLLSIAGIVASLSILKQELGESTFIGKALCSSTDEKKDCSAVLSSKGATIIKNHKLSDLSILYFTGLLLSTFLINNFNILYIASILALPITLYSIYYQYSVIKSWCRLCLSVVGILWLQGLLAFMKISPVNALLNLSSNTIIITAISFITIYIIWSFIKPLYEKVAALKEHKIEAVKFKRNFNLFDTLLKKSPTIDTLIERDNEIVLGNKNANLELIIITNPFCGHCKPVHKMVNKILDKYQDLVKIIIRFNVLAEKPESDGVIVATKLLQLYHEQGENDCKKAMDDIYGGMALEKWIAKWQQTTNFNLYASTLQNEKEWCTQNNINFTPEILINGKSFPKEYKREDLLFFIEELEEHHEAVTL